MIYLMLATLLAVAMPPAQACTGNCMFPSIVISGSEPSYVGESPHRVLGADPGEFRSADRRP